MLAGVVRLARMAGLRVPKVSLRVVAHLPNHHAYTEGRRITVERKSLTAELLAHELAHVIADQVVTEKVPAHNRFWGAVYAVLYQAVVEP